MLPRLRTIWAYKKSMRPKERLQSLSMLNPKAGINSFRRLFSHLLLLSRRTSKWKLTTILNRNTKVRVKLCFNQWWCKAIIWLKDPNIWCSHHKLLLLAIVSPSKTQGLASYSPTSPLRSREVTSSLEITVTSATSRFRIHMSKFKLCRGQIPLKSRSTKQTLTTTEWRLNIASWLRTLTWNLETSLSNTKS